MERKQKIIIATIIAFVLILMTVGVVLLSSVSKEDKVVKEDKVSATHRAEKEEKENKKKEDKDKKDKESAKEADDGKEEADKEAEKELDDSKAVAMKTTANVNLRKEPNTDSEIIKLLCKGTELSKYSEENGWAKVKVGDDIGYVSAEFLADPSKVEEEPAQAQVPSTPKVEAIPGQHRNPNSAVVVIDPGHQRYGDSAKEPNGPGASVMKARVTGGTSGVATGVAEYILNLDISLKLKAELENRGYTVYMTRTSHDVNISNMERAQYASSVGADIAVRIHANGGAAAVRGAETLVPSSGNPYVSHLAAASYSLGRNIINSYCAATGFGNRGVKANDTMTGINWSEVPVTIIELGFMSNPAEDQAMQDATMQNNMVQGIANGIDAYFGF
jgi:N-acetylmuramoyl-L-alanine amidase